MCIRDSHTAQEALKSFDIAQNIFERTSFDLIYARQHQSLSQWENELKQALSLGLNHMSLYQLTIEPGTAFSDRFEKGNLKGLPDEDLASDLFEMTRELCDAGGLRAYEVSNHAKSDHECRHNLVYWNYGDYAGIGPGAHGRLTLGNARYSTDTYKQPAKWLTEVENGSGDSSVSPLSLSEQGTEMVLMGMRLSTGISKNRFQSLFGIPPSDTVLKELASQGFINIEGEQIMATRDGTLLLNHLVGQLLLSIP